MALCGTGDCQCSVPWVGTVLDSYSSLVSYEWKWESARQWNRTQKGSAGTGTVDTSHLRRFRFAPLPANSPRNCNRYMLQGRTLRRICLNKQYRTPNRMAEPYSLLRIERQILPSGCFMFYLYARKEGGGWIHIISRPINFPQVCISPYEEMAGSSSTVIYIYLIIPHASDHAAETP